MSDFKKINTLSAVLTAKLDQLVAGELDVAEMEALSELAREVYERVVVLRHKAYELSVGGHSENVSNASEALPMFKITPQKPAPDNQISLIDAIEEVEMPILAPEIAFDPIPAAPKEKKKKQPEQKKPVAESSATPSQDKKPQPEKKVESKAKANIARIADLTKSIGLNEKFRFVNDLFAGDKNAYEQTIAALNAATDLAAAQAILASKVPAMVEEDESEENNTRELLESYLERRFV